MREQTEWWLQTAQQDLDVARTLIERSYFAAAAFHCQQASEKALKAVFVERGQNERSHSNLELLANLRQQGLAIDDELFHRARKLDRSYIDSRYPNGIGGPPQDFYDQKTAEELLEWAFSVMDFAKSNLS
ncbi:MAG: HEPN domain-containing protein [Armatimonadetes bacterium]|nr:HEPN domain-containing protein [Armatimonadota bacterium]